MAEPEVAVVSMEAGTAPLLTPPNPENYPETQVQSAGWTNTAAKVALPAISTRAPPKQNSGQLCCVCPYRERVCVYQYMCA